MIFFLTLFFTASTSQACDFCMLGQGINPYLTANGSGVTLAQDFIQSSKMYDGHSEVPSHGKKETWSVTSVTGFFPLNEDLTLMFTVPYANKTNIDFEEADNSNPGIVTSGLADAYVTARYTVYKVHNLDSTWIGGVIGGIKFPTGKTGVTDSSGSPVDRHALPGTGSYDGIFGLTGSYASASGYQFTSDLVYNLAGVGKWGGRRHQFGDSLNFSLKGFYRITQSESKDRSYFIFTGPQYEHTGKEIGTQTDTAYEDRTVNAATGGDVLFWSLGFYAVVGPTMIVNMSFAQSIYHNMNYDAAFDVDPAENYKTNLSLTFLF